MMPSIKRDGWHRIEAGHYARRLSDGRNLVVKRRGRKWYDHNGGEHSSLHSAIRKSENDAGETGQDLV